MPIMSACQCSCAREMSVVKTASGEIAVCLHCDFPCVHGMQRQGCAECERLAKSVRQR